VASIRTTQCDAASDYALPILGAPHGGSQPELAAQLNKSPSRAHGWQGAVRTLLPAALIVYLGFNAGGFFAGSTGLAAAVSALLLAAWIGLVRRPFAAVSASSVVALTAIALYAAWSLLSALWSHSSARALIEFDRALLYLLVVGLAALVFGRPKQMRMLVRGVTAGLAVVCGAGFLSRTLPQVFPTAAGFQNERLSYPVTYWNGLGMLAVLAIACCVHLASDEHEHRLIRSAAAAAIPALASTLLLTFSRGSIAAIVAALVLYAIFVPTLNVLGTALSCVPTSAIALVITYRADALSSAHFTRPAGISQGHRVALVVAACMVGAGLLRLVLTAGERRSASLGLPRIPRRVGSLVLIGLVLLIGVVLASDGWVAREYHTFSTANVVTSTQARGRLTSASNNGRLAMWRIAVRGFRSAPLDGLGAGTYVQRWQRNRPVAVPAQDAHSLYLETLDELGIPGLLTLAAFLIALLVGASRRLLSESDRALSAIGVAGLAAVALHAAVDWDWELPVVLVPALMLAAAAGARRDGAAGSEPRTWSRVALCASTVALAGAPGLMALSQTELNASVRAFDRGDCREATAHASAAGSIMSMRPEPFEVIGYCDTYHGSPGLGQRAISRAIARDRNDWEFHYAMAIAMAVGRKDPRPQLLLASRLNPLEPLLVQAREAFAASTRRTWRTVALGLPVDVQ